GEYIWAKFSSVLALFLVVLVGHLLLTIFFNQVMPNDNAELIRGPFSWTNYLRPAIFLALPFLVFLCGTSLAIGEWTRRPILVFVAPVAFFLVSVFFLWSWSPSWLDPRINRLLMWIEPSGFRWLNETWLKVDLGVEVYNQQPVGYDLPFLLSRLVYVLAGFAAVALASRHFAVNLRGRKATAPSRWRLLRRKREAEPPAETAHAVAAQGSLTDLGMRSGQPSFLRTALDVARFEARNLRSQPGLYIFVPLILLQTIGSTFFQVGAFDTPLLLTPGTAAVGAMNTLTLLVAFLILFYTVESVSREWRTGLAPMFYATPTRTGAVLLGKAMANSIVGVTILLASYLGGAIVMLVQGKVAPAIGPFLLVWGLLLVPTFLVWSAFTTAAFALTGNRFSTYGLGLAMMAYTGWKQTVGEMNWVGNWTLWDATTWTDFGGLDPNTRALFLNRLFWLAVMAFLIALTVRLFPRREYDSGRIFDRLRPRPLLKTGWQLAPVALPAVVIGVVLWVQTTQGFQGGAPERREEEYRGRNLVTWGEAETPRFTEVDIDLTLEPDESSFAVQGTYRMVNGSEGLMRRFPLSVGDHFEDLSWTLNGEAYEPDNWARMYVFTPPEPLAPGDPLEVGFEYHGRLPNGITKNGGGMGQFILPSGVVLTSFGSNFLPVPYFEGGRGVDADNQLEPRSYEEGFWEGRTKPGLASGGRFQVRTRITGPARFAYHGVGVRESEEVTDDRRTVVWRTDHPVNFFNVVAGEWDVWEGEGVAIYHLPEHDYNIEEMGEALEASRKYFSEWFYPYPWEELKVSEFPGLDSYAQGFPTNITFSESIGFLTRSTDEARVAFLVTAHEAAHQWWGNILLPGQGPGGNILSEGMAHFSTLLLSEQVHGLRGRIEFARRIEERYGDNRRVDSERSLVWTDGSKAGDTTVTYDKGGWVFWMLLNHLGRDIGLAGVQDFIARYAESDDYPVLQDFVAVLREHATDVEAYDAFVEQWFFDVVVPQYRFESAEVTPAGGGFTVTAVVQNFGSGRMPVEIAAVRGERFPEDSEDVEQGEVWREARTTITLDAGESATVTIP
ncbi:MAG: M1 family aminopeptidase, partial [Acidobacteriota bacterium]